MMFSKLPAGARRIEITECDEFEVMDFLIPGQHFLKHQLRLAVGIDWTLWQVFSHRNLVWRTIGGAGGAEDKFLDAGFHAGIEQIQTRADIVSEIFPRVGHT